MKEFLLEGESPALSRSATREATRMFTFGDNNLFPFHLWWTEIVLKCEKVYKYFFHDCLKILFLVWASSKIRRTLKTSVFGRTLHECCPVSIWKTRSSRPAVFCKKSFLKNFTKFTGKHLCQSFSFGNSLALKMRLKSKWVLK